MTTDSGQTCRSCGAAIRWAKSASSGKPMILDRDPVPFDQGGIVLSQVAFGEPIAVVLGYALRAAVQGADGQPALFYRSHFATCRDAAAWRKHNEKQAAQPAGKVSQ